MLTAREHEDALEALLRGAVRGESPVKTMRELRGLSYEDMARRTGMPEARFMGEEDKRLTLTDDELDAIAAALRVPVDLLMD